MSAAALLTHLDAVGVQITREAQALRVRGNPGVNPAPYREHISVNKPALLRELLRREIVAAASVEPGQFDRRCYDDLWAQWRALPDPEAEAAALVPQLETGWDWLTSHPDHPEYEAFLDRWLTKLRDYEQTYSNGDRNP